MVYAPVQNEQYAFDGSSCGRIAYYGQMKVFCYAKSTTLSYILADNVKAFFNGLQLTGSIDIEIGQDRAVNDLNNGLFEAVCIFNLTQFT